MLIKTLSVFDKSKNQVKLIAIKDKIIMIKAPVDFMNIKLKDWGV